ncbi:MAG: Hsp20/alpha crystallin family protein [Pseudomonadota bacterium]
MKEDKEKAEESETREEPRSVTEDILDSVGDLIPGLGGVINGLKKVDAFKEKLALIDEEVERRLEETPLRGTDSGMPGAFARARSRPPSGIPPSVARRGSRSKKRFDAFAAGYHPIDKSERDVFVDIFEEEKKIRVIAELPGVNEEDISLDLIEDLLTVAASRGNHNYRKDIKLPRTVESITGKTYNNGILEVTLG